VGNNPELKSLLILVSSYLLPFCKLLLKITFLMEITEFLELSIGRWRSQRSGHHLAFAHFEQVVSNIDIEPLGMDIETHKQIWGSTAGPLQFEKRESFADELLAVRALC
jgi:hypothetical protein